MSRAVFSGLIVSFPKVLFFLLPKTEGNCPKCSGDRVEFREVAFRKGDVCEYVAATSIETGLGVVVDQGATVTFRAPVVAIGSGILVEQGTVFKIIPSSGD